MPKNKNAIFEISSVEVETANDPYLDENFRFPQATCQNLFINTFQKKHVLFRKQLIDLTIS